MTRVGIKRKAKVSGGGHVHRQADTHKVFNTLGLKDVCISTLSGVKHGVEALTHAIYMYSEKVVSWCDE